MRRLGEDFFHRPALEVAPELVGKLLVHGDRMLRITETEAYCGEADTACHAHKGRTARTRVLYARAGTAYIYLCYGVHWLINVVTGEVDEPEAVLIRACEDAAGPGKLTKRLGITGQLNERDVCTDAELWFADDGYTCEVKTGRRVGIDYAAEEDRERLWRFMMK